MANELLVYREVVSAAFKELQPHIRVHTTKPANLDKEFLRLSPKLVVCNRVMVLVEREAPLGSSFTQGTLPGRSSA